MNFIEISLRDELETRRAQVQQLSQLVLKLAEENKALKAENERLKQTNITIQIFR